MPSCALCGVFIKPRRQNTVFYSSFPSSASPFSGERQANNSNPSPFSAMPALASAGPSRLRLYPRPGTARWLGFASLATSTTALTPSSAMALPPRLRFVGMFLLVEAVVRAYVERLPRRVQEQLDAVIQARMKQTVA